MCIKTITIILLVSQTLFAQIQTSPSTSSSSSSSTPSISSSPSNQSQCPIAQYFKFTTKQSITHFDIIPNPYTNPTSQYLDRVQDNLRNRERVCALRYLDQAREKYEIKVFGDRGDAEREGWIVTHQGVCGKCSTSKDLYVYLTRDLTQPVRACGARYFYSLNKVRRCIKNLGFTAPCTQVWLWNTVNTRKHCGKICMWSFITHQPFIINGQLNKCLQCDQDISGPIFKYESGRTRRNSGIKSQIDRPSDQIYNLTHCYY